MEDILLLIDEFQKASGEWANERLLGFNDEGRLAAEAHMTAVKTALIEAILGQTG